MNATAAAYARLSTGSSVIDAIEAGCNVCEFVGCDGSVGMSKCSSQSPNLIPTHRRDITPSHSI
jgi:hypothetical protein